MSREELERAIEANRKEFGDKIPSKSKDVEPEEPKDIRDDGDYEYLKNKRTAGMAGISHTVRIKNNKNGKIFTISATASVSGTDDEAFLKGIQNYLDVVLNKMHNYC